MKKIIIDTDLGDDIDDAFALLSAIAQPDFDILGVTTVFKNTVQRARIAKTIFRLAGRVNVPVYTGIDTPMNGIIPKWDYEEVMSDGKIRVHHYKEEMQTEQIEEGGVDFILDTAEKYPGEVTLIALGPFTNVAAAILKDAKRFSKLKEVFVMCGHPGGNYAEWNVRVDPKAAEILFNSGVKITAYGLNVTTHCKLYEAQQEKMKAFASSSVSLVRDMMNIWIESNNRHADQPRRYPTMHDPLCILSYVQRDICTYQDVKIKICEKNGLDGYTIIGDEGAPITIAETVDVEKFYDAFFTALDAVDKK
ncbi:MAG: nucleoside hydrolase [Clostridia bacterium]|nr:nucleoside hydrolase [Clostridia bacterium]